MILGIPDVIGAIWKYLEQVVDHVGSFIGQMWKNLRDLFNGAVAWLWDKVCYCCDSIIWYFLNRDENEPGLLWWFCGQLLDLGKWFFEQLPDITATVGSYSYAFSITMDLIGKLNNFLPVLEATMLFGTFLTFITLFLSIKLVMKLLPWIG